MGQRMIGKEEIIQHYDKKVSVFYADMPIYLRKIACFMRECLRLRVPLLLLYTLFSLIAFAQGRRITGTVTDDNGVPLAGATVTLKGTTIMSTTDVAGNFVLNTTGQERTVVVSYVGMKPQEVTVGSNDVVSVSMASTAGTLSDVVVVGYGSSRRANLTTAQTSIGTKEIEKTVNTTVEQALQGRSPGVYVTQNSGQPGGASP